jgi:hypothetical protein
MTIRSTLTEKYMTATTLEPVHEEDAPASVAGRVDAGLEDAYWHRSHSLEHYYKPGLDYEDYAAAYCVGYIGYAQYGGAFEDGEKSLCANWVRIKGDSRLSLDDAMLAARAAWNRMAWERAEQAAPRPLPLKLIRQRLAMPSFRFGASQTR